MRTYVAKCGKTQYKQSQSTLIDAAEREDSTGFCLACGADQSGCEPDMRKGKCESCGADKVYGAEELILMRLYYREGAP